MTNDKLIWGKNRDTVFSTTQTPTSSQATEDSVQSFVPHPEAAYAYMCDHDQKTMKWAYKSFLSLSSIPFNS